MAAVGMAGAGPTLWVSVRARDRTKEVFDKVSRNIDRMSMTALQAVGRIGSLTMSFATLYRMTGSLNDEQAKVIGIFGMMMGIIPSIVSITNLLTKSTGSYVTILTWKVSLETLGIGVAIAAASAMAILAMQTTKATDAQKDYNKELERGTITQRRVTAHKRTVFRGGYAEATHV